MQMKNVIKNKRGITLVALVITIVILIILAAVAINFAFGENGLITRAIEASFRSEIASVREILNLYQIENQMGNEISLTKFIPVKLEETDKWEVSLKREIYNWGKYGIDINQATDNYIKENFNEIIGNDGQGNINNLFYIENPNLKEKKYLYNPTTDIIYKIKSTSIGKYDVHSIEELDYLRNGGERNPTGKNYTIISYTVEFKNIGNLSYYEPDLNGLGQEVTSLVFYKQINGEITTEEYQMNSKDWIDRGRPNKIEENGNTYILYDYENKIWANIRIKNGSIETNWTWIPRYAYENDDTITDVKFVRTTDTIPSGYEIAGSFEENDKKGIWVSKYEPNYQVQTDSTYFSYYIPDLTNFNKENTYIELYDKESNTFDKEVKASEVADLSEFSRKNLWFDYDNKIWANIKVVKNGIETWWVWIPRYAYSVGNNTSEVVFIDTDNRPLDGSKLSDAYEIAGAFEGNNKKGIWISKYEPTAITDGMIENIQTIPDLSGFDRNNTYIEIYDKQTNMFKQEVKLADIDNIEEFVRSNLWYDYSQKIWANIKVVKNGIETWWVWIPRYAYSNGIQTTDIRLITKENKLLNGGEIPSSYTIAEIFKNNDKAGMWVSKYEPMEK